MEETEEKTFKTIREFFKDGELEDIDSDDLVKALADPVKTAKMFLNIYPMLVDKVDLSKYEKHYKEISYLDQRLEMDIAFGRSARKRRVHNYVMLNKEVSSFISEVSDSLPRGKSIDEKLKKLSNFEDEKEKQ